MVLSLVMLVLGVPAVLVWALVYHARQEREQRPERVRALAAQWEHVLAVRELNPSSRLCQVARVQGRFRRGIKAWLRVEGEWDGPWRDSWFEYAVTPALRAGEWLVIVSGAGWGPHTNKDGVLYVGGVLAVAGPGALEAHHELAALEAAPEATERPAGP